MPHWGKIIRKPYNDREISQDQIRKPYYRAEMPHWGKIIRKPHA
jgi:hypothetical protein